MDGKHSISTDRYSIWYPSQACKFLNIECHHHLHISHIYEKSMIERTIQRTSRIKLYALMTIFHIERKKV
jgi:hypothetical protein